MNIRDGTLIALVTIILYLLLVALLVGLLIFVGMDLKYFSDYLTLLGLLLLLFIVLCVGWGVVFYNDGERIS